MKIITTIIITFIVALLTSLLLDWTFIKNNSVRYYIIVAFIIFIFITGILTAYSFIKPKSKE